jgi:hypothetical protein
MNSKSLSAIAAVILICSLLFSWVPPAKACGPFFLGAVFTYSKHPDIPLNGFVQGRIGVIQPSYARSYLYAAYRQMTGPAFDQPEQEALLALWKERLDSSWDFSEDGALKPWLDARAAVPGTGPAPKISLYRNREKPNEWESYLNCQEDAFATAANTLADRQKAHAAETAEIKDWIKAQDTVFSNCSEGQIIPSDLPAGAPGWLRTDRQYQIAAANFYAARFKEATEQFTAIAGDRSSPWNEIATYMIARTSLRQASLGKDEEKQPALAEAETKLQQILGEKRLSSQHHASGRLLNLVRLRLHPEAKLHELSAAILRKGAGETLKQDVWDYTLLLDKFLGDNTEDSGPAKEVPAAVTSDDVTDWIVTFESESPTSLDRALKKLEGKNSLPWLVTALMKVDSKHPQVEKLLAAAAKVERSSPAFASVNFYRIRLLMDSGNVDAARQVLDEILLKDRARVGPSAVNKFLGQRMLLARNLGEFLRDAPRVPAGFSYDEDGRELPADDEEIGSAKKEETSLLFDQDAANMFNEQVPLSVLVAAAESPVLPKNLRRMVTQAAWLRAALLNRRIEAERLTALLSAAYPELKEVLSGYQKEVTPEGRRFAAAYLALRFPGLRPTVTAGVSRSGPLDELDSYRDNWWCLAGNSSAIFDEEPAKTNAKVAPARIPLFLSPADSALAAKEGASLNTLGAAPNYLSRTAIEWANRKPTDARAPEALHLAVTATRRGCTDKETGRWSKAAFDLLHRRFPTSPWARKTKYWFKD